MVALSQNLRHFMTDSWDPFSKSVIKVIALWWGVWCFQVSNVGLSSCSFNNHFFLNRRKLNFNTCTWGIHLCMKIPSVIFFKSFNLCTWELFAYKIHYKVNTTLILKKSSLMLLGLCATVKATYILVYGKS